MERAGKKDKGKGRDVQIQEKVQQFAFVTEQEDDPERGVADTNRGSNAKKRKVG